MRRRREAAVRFGGQQQPSGDRARTCFWLARANSQAQPQAGAERRQLVARLRRDRRESAAPGCLHHPASVGRRGRPAQAYPLRDLQIDGESRRAASFAPGKCGRSRSPCERQRSQARESLPKAPRHYSPAAPLCGAVEKRRRDGGGSARAEPPNVPGHPPTKRVAWLALPAYVFGKYRAPPRAAEACYDFSCHNSATQARTPRTFFFIGNWRSNNDSRREMFVPFFAECPCNSTVTAFANRAK